MIFQEICAGVAIFILSMAVASLTIQFFKKFFKCSEIKVKKKYIAEYCMLFFHSFSIATILLFIKYYIPFAN